MTQPKEGEVFAIRSDRQDRAAWYASSQSLGRSLLRYDDEGAMLYPTYRAIDNKIEQGRYIVIEDGVLKGDIYTHPAAVHPIEFRINVSQDIHSAMSAMNHIVFGMQDRNTLAGAISLRAEALLDLFQANYLALSGEDFDRLHESTLQMQEAIGIHADNHVGGNIGEAIDFLLKGSTGRDSKKPNPLISETTLAGAMRRAEKGFHKDEHIQKFMHILAALQWEHANSRNIVDQLADMYTPGSRYAVSLQPSTPEEYRLPWNEIVGPAQTVATFLLRQFKVKPYRTFAIQATPVATQLFELAHGRNWRAIEDEQLVPTMWSLLQSVREDPRQSGNRAA